MTAKKETTKEKTRSRSRRKRRGVTPAGVRKLAMALPEATEGTSYGTPAWKVRGRLFARLHQDGESLVVRTGFDEREIWLAAEPRACFFTDHYARYEMMQVRLSEVEPATLRELVNASWRRAAPARLLRVQGADGAGRP